MNSKKYFLSLLLGLLAVDILILLNIIVLRQILAFAYFIFIPGLLIIHILKLEKLDFLKKFVLSIGLSVAFLMLSGLFINEIGIVFGIEKPLALPLLLGWLNIFLFILVFFAYKTNKKEFDLKSFFNININIQDKNLIFAVIPVLFPFLTFFGTYLMNATGNNIILLIMLFSVLIYFVSIIVLYKKIPKITYPISIVMIGLSLLLMRGLTSNYLMGGDITLEYYALKTVTSNLRWEMVGPALTIQPSALSISLLPGIFKILLGISNIYVYKLVYLIIFSIIPLIGYIIYTKYFSSLNAFLASLFFIIQIPFIYLLTRQMRVGIALLFLSILLLILFNMDIERLKKKILLIIFIFALILSYYVTPLFMILLFFSFWLVSLKDKEDKNYKIISFYTLILCFILLFLWWGQIKNTYFDTYVLNIKKMLTHLSYIFDLTMRSPEVQKLFLLKGTLTEKLRSISLFLISSIIAIGVFFSIKKNKILKFEKGYLAMAIVSLICLLAMIFIPYLSILYGADRLYLQLLIILAPAFIIGCYSIYSKSRKFGLTLIVIILILQFLLFTYLADAVLYKSSNEMLSQGGKKFDMNYVKDGEIKAAEWLMANNIESLKTYIDYSTENDFRQASFFAYSDLFLGRTFDLIPNFYEKNTPPPDNFFIFLRYANVVNKKVYGFGSLLEGAPLENYEYLISNEDKVYANDAAEIYGGQNAT